MAEENIDEAAQAVRRPPSSVLSEQAILAGLMIDNSALDSVSRRPSGLRKTMS